MGVLKISISSWQSSPWWLWITAKTLTTAETVRFLKLADGKGWVFETKDRLLVMSEASFRGRDWGHFYWAWNLMAIHWKKRLFQVDSQTFRLEMGCETPHVPLQSWLFGVPGWAEVKLQLRMYTCIYLHIYMYIYICIYIFWIGLKPTFPQHQKRWLPQPV